MIVGLVAAGCLLGAIAMLWSVIRTFWRTNGWTETTGQVIDRHGDSDDWDSTVRFEDSDGIEYTFRSEYGGSEGSAVTVKYPPRDPDRAQTSSDVNEERERGLFVVAVLVAGGSWAALWSVGRIGMDRPIEWFHPENWPTRGDDLRWRARWMQIRWKRRQAKFVEREQNRVPLEGGPEPSPLRRRIGVYQCEGCGRQGTMKRVPNWLPGYTIRRCTYCLCWHRFPGI